jgi:hypothetical protein
MRRIAFFVLAVFAVLVPAVAQSGITPVVQEQLFNNINTASVSITSIAPPGTSSGQIPNLGQFGHTAFVVFQNNGGGTCSNPNWQGGFEFSFDNTNWYTFGYWTYNPSVVLNQTIYASGSYPYVRFRILWSNSPPNCALSAWYTGSVLQTPVTGVQGSAATNTAMDMLGNGQTPSPVIVGGLVGFAPNGSAAAPVPLCGANQAINVSSGTSQDLVGEQNNARVYVCSISLMSNTASATATVFESTSNTCSPAATTLGTWVGMAAGVPIVIGNGLGAVFRTQTLGHFICISASGGTITGHASFGVIASTAGGY